MRNGFFAAILLGLSLAGPAAYGQEQDAVSKYKNNQLRERSAYRQDTDLGDFIIGSHGLEKNEREESKTGDLEVGKVFEFKNDRIIPNIVELETFFLNRFGSYEDSLYESLGFGAGTQLNYRKAGDLDKWFLRFAAIVPTEYYQERYGLEDDRSIFELIAGRSYSVAPVADSQILRRRTAFYSLTATVPATAIQSKAWSDANAAALLDDYLRAHHLQLKQADVFSYAKLSLFDFIIVRSQVKLSERENHLLDLHDNARVIPDSWRGTFNTLFGRAISILLRDKCVLVFNVSNAGDAQAVQAFASMPDGVVGDDQAMDLDRMIETYLDTQWEVFTAPVHLR